MSNDVTGPAGKPKHWKRGQHIEVNGQKGKIGTYPLPDPKNPQNVYFRADLPGGVRLRVDVKADGDPK